MAKTPALIVFPPQKGIAGIAIPETAREHHPTTDFLTTRLRNLRRGFNEMHKNQKKITENRLRVLRDLQGVKRLGGKNQSRISIL